MVQKLDIKLKYKEKRFRNSATSEYNQIMFSPKLTYSKKGSYSVNLIAGVNSYDYLSSAGNNQLKLFSKLGIKKYTLEKKTCAYLLV